MSQLDEVSCVALTLRNRDPSSTKYQHRLTTTVTSMRIQCQNWWTYESSTHRVQYKYCTPECMYETQICIWHVKYFAHTHTRYRSTVGSTHPSISEKSICNSAQCSTQVQVSHSTVVLYYSITLHISHHDWERQPSLTLQVRPAPFCFLHFGPSTFAASPPPWSTFACDIVGSWSRARKKRNWPKPRHD